MFGFIVVVLFFFIVVVQFFKFLGWLINELQDMFPNPKRKAELEKAKKEHEEWNALTFEQQRDILEKKERLFKALDAEFRY